MNVSTPAPQGRLSAVEWATIIATCITILVSVCTISFMSGSYGTRIDHISEATKDVPKDIQALKSDLTHLQELKVKVEELSKLEGRIIKLESQIK